MAAAPQPLRDLAAWVRTDLRGDGSRCPLRGQQADRRSAAALEPPSLDRIEQYAQEWLRVLKVAVPAVKEAVQKARAEAEAQEAAARRAAERQELRRLGRLEVAGVPSPMAKAGSPLPASVETPVAAANDDVMVISNACSVSAPRSTSLASGASGGLASGLGSPGADGSPPTVLSGVSSLLTSFDRLFSESHDHGSASHGGPIKFRVRVPQGYPGVQFRKTKDYDDRYSKYAKNGTIVRGFLEEDGTWVRLSETVFLPVKVNNMLILEAIEEGQSSKQFWFACGQGGMEEEEEVLSNLDDIK